MKLTTGFIVSIVLLFFTTVAIVFYVPSLLEGISLAMLAGIFYGWLGSWYDRK